LTVNDGQYHNVMVLVALTTIDVFVHNSLGNRMLAYVWLISPFMRYCTVK